MFILNVRMSIKWIPFFSATSQKPEENEAAEVNPKPNSNKCFDKSKSNHKNYHINKRITKNKKCSNRHSFPESSGGSNPDKDKSLDGCHDDNRTSSGEGDINQVISISNVVSSTSTVLSSKVTNSVTSITHNQSEDKTTVSITWPIVKCRLCDLVEDSTCMFLTCAKCIRDPTKKTQDRVTYCSIECCREDWITRHKAEHGARLWPIFMIHKL